MRCLLVGGLLIALTTPAFGEELYNTLLLRAAPGKLTDLISFYKHQGEGIRSRGDTPPFMLRHSQGDQWDLMLIFPMGRMHDYVAPERMSRRGQPWAVHLSGPDLPTAKRTFHSLVSWHEETIVEGPDLEVVRKAFSGAAFFHVEMFVALAGQYGKLVQQREMENVYLKTLGRPENLIFTHRMGGQWDVYTLGFYRDIKHYAESADITESQEEEAARKAGFESASTIGTYLRTLISSHHDTLAVAVPD